MQRIITVEEAIWLEYDEINAFELLCQIQDWLGEVCQRDFDYGWDHFMLFHGDREELINEAQRRGFDAAVANYDEDCREDAAMRLEKRGFDMEHIKKLLETPGYTLKILFFRGEYFGEILNGENAMMGNRSPSLDLLISALNAACCNYMYGV